MNVEITNKLPDGNAEVTLKTKRAEIRYSVPESKADEFVPQLQKQTKNQLLGLNLKYYGSFFLSYFATNAIMKKVVKAKSVFCFLASAAAGILTSAATMPLFNKSFAKKDKEFMEKYGAKEIERIDVYSQKKAQAAASEPQK